MLKTIETECQTQISISNNVSAGALKLQEWTMQEWTSVEDVAGMNIAGVDNDGGKAEEVDNDGMDFTEWS